MQPGGTCQSQRAALARTLRSLGQLEAQMTVRFAPLASDDPVMVAGYELRARLGVGGMGRVYLSFSPGGRALAIKVLRPEYAEDEEFHRRFRQEVAAAQRVQSLYTAPVVD